MEKPFAPSCERNGGPIKNVLNMFIKDKKRLLEVGSGTGQHAVQFAPSFPNLTWVTSDQLQYHEGIKLWLDEANLPNIEGPLSFRLGEDSFPTSNVDVVYTANTFHIMPWELVEELIGLTAANLEKDSLFIIYGPFKYEGAFTSQSNEDFDHMLRQKAPHQGIRDFEKVHDLLVSRGFSFVDDILMPSNNQTLIFKK